MAYIESKIKKKDELAKLPQKNQTLGNDNICQSKCKEKFRTGFDMIKVFFLVFKGIFFFFSFFLGVQYRKKVKVISK